MGRRELKKIFFVAYFFLIINLFVLYRSSFSFATEEGSLLITSKPSGAAVYLDNNKIANTDIMFDKIPAGTYKITVELPGYKKSEQQVEIKADLTKTVHFDLQPLADTVELKPVSSAPPVAEPPKKKESQRKAQEPIRSVLRKSEPQKKEPEKSEVLPAEAQTKPEETVYPPAEAVKSSSEVQPPMPIPGSPQVKEPPRQQAESRGPTPLVRKSLFEMTDLWFALLIILALIVMILLTLVLKFISQRKKSAYGAKTAQTIRERRIKMIARRF